MNLNYSTVGININSNDNKAAEIATPQNICNDMSDLFDYTNCNNKLWADIYCKTGNTLVSLKAHGVNPNNILAICNNKQSQMFICRKLYGKILEEQEVNTTKESIQNICKITRRGQIYCITNWKEIVKSKYNLAKEIIYEIIKEYKNTMSSLERERERVYNSALMKISASTT